MELLFYSKAVPASATTAVNLVGYTAETQWVATRSGSLQRLLLILTDAVTAGSLVGTVKKNGAAVALAVTLNTTSPLLGSKTDPGISYQAGDLLELVSTGLAPTTADALGVLQGT